MINASFKDYPLDEEVLRAIEMLQFKSPTKVQQQVIPAVLEQKDVIVKSQTGSGKTAAFAIPLSQLVDWNENKAQVLVLTPTRELAIQVKEDIFNIGRFKRLKVCALYGKAPFYSQEKELRQKTHVVVGTPGRVIDHLERGTLDPSNIKYLVIDEADEMLNMGFIEAIETIIASLSKERVSLLLSATLPRDIERLCKKIMKEPVYIEIEEQNSTSDRIAQERYHVDEADKIKLLKDIITLENPDSCMIFCNTKQRVESLFQELKKQKVPCEKIHGDMEQKDRVRVMDNFKKGSFRYLIATDLASRGIDVDKMSLVINFDLPKDEERYVHRIGRTGRVDNTGKAITFVAENENRFLKDIHQYLGKEIPTMERPQKERVEASKEAFALKIHSRPEQKEAKGLQLNLEIMKIHINAGKKTKMRPVDIVGTLCSLDGMKAEDIGIIHIVDISSFVEILNNKGEMVLEKLQTTPIKGRLRNCSRVEV